MKTKHRIAQSMRAASAITGFPLGVVQAAKWSGCAAFKDSGRVDCHELVEWIWTSDDVPASIYQLIGHCMTGDEQIATLEKFGVKI